MVQIDHHDSSVVTADGVTLRCRCWGNPSGQPILLLHGGGQTGWAWEATAVHLAAIGYRCIAPDFRGHGDSDWSSAGRYDLDDFTADVMAVARWIDSPELVAVGASLGGISAIMAQSRENLFARLALVDITPRWESEGLDRILDFLNAHPEGFPHLEAASDAIANYLPHRRRPSSLEGLKRNLVQRDDQRWYWCWDPAMMTIARQHAARWTPLIETAARSIEAPVLLISGEHSEVVSPATIADFLNLVPHAEHVQVSRAHHMVAGDENDQFTRAISQWLAAPLRATA